MDPIEIVLWSSAAVAWGVWAVAKFYFLPKARRHALSLMPVQKPVVWPEEDLN